MDARTTRVPGETGKKGRRVIERLEGRSVPVVSDARVVARIDVADTWMMTDGPFTETKELFGG